MLHSKYILDTNAQLLQSVSLVTSFFSVLEDIIVLEWELESVLMFQFVYAVDIFFATTI